MLITSYINYRSVSKAFITCLFLALLVSQKGFSNETNVIALFGDSITVGENDSFPWPLRPFTSNGRIGNDGFFPALPPSDFLDTILIDESRQSTVANWGIGGSTTGSGAIRITGSLAVTRSNFPADNYYVLIMYGTNDFAGGLSQSTTGFNTGLMIDRARAQGYIPVIGTLTPRIDRDVSPYNQQIVAAANSRGVPVVDHFSRFWQFGFDLLDVEIFNGSVVRLHPTATGYQVIARLWFDSFLVNAIEPVSPITISPIINLLLEDE